MTIKELIKALRKLDAERVVVLSTDPEGNNYSLLDKDFLEGAYKAGQVGLEHLTGDHSQAGYTQDDVLENGKPAIIFYPKGQA